MLSCCYLVFLSHQVSAGCQVDAQGGFADGHACTRGAKHRGRAMHCITVVLRGPSRVQCWVLYVHKMKRQAPPHQWSKDAFLGSHFPYLYGFLQVNESSAIQQVKMLGGAAGLEEDLITGHLTAMKTTEQVVHWQARALFSASATAGWGRGCRR